MYFPHIRKKQNGEKKVDTIFSSQSYLRFQIFPQRQERWIDPFAQISDIKISPNFIISSQIWYIYIYIYVLNGRREILKQINLAAFNEREVPTLLSKWGRKRDVSTLQRRCLFCSIDWNHASWYLVSHALSINTTKQFVYSQAKINKQRKKERKQKWIRRKEKKEKEQRTRFGSTFWIKKKKIYIYIYIYKARF